MNWIQKLKTTYQNGTTVDKLIYINVAVFILGILTNVVQSLYKADVNWLFNWFALDTNTNLLLSKPWSIISYGFLHANFIHILCNLITLYYIGNLFIEYFTQKQLLTFYLLGTFFGGLFYLFSQNYFPLFQSKSSLLVGASAGISAIFIGITTYMPNYQLKIRFIGFIKLWHLAIFWLFFNVLGLISENAGGSFSHLGGALFGFLYVNNASNKKLTFFDTIFRPFKKSNLKTVHKSTNKKNNNSSTSKNIDQQKIDTILDKISKSGYDTLSKEEKEFLFKQRK